MGKHNKKLNNHGAALVVALIVFLTLIVISEAVWLSLRQSSKRLVREIQQVKAYYIAEAGVAKAIWYLKGNSDKDINWRVKDLEEPMGEWGSYTISIESAKSGISITSYGITNKPGSPKARVRATLKVAWPEAFNQAAYSEAYLSVNGNSTQASGALASRDRVYVEGLADKGLKTLSFSKIPFPTLDSRQYQAQIAAFDRMLQEPRRAEKLYQGAQTFTQAYKPQLFSNKVTYVEGNAFFEGSDGVSLEIAGPGIIVASGKITLNRSVVLSQDIVLVAKEGIVVEGSGEINQGVLYSPAAIEIKGNTRVSGNLYSKSTVMFSDSSEMGPTQSLAYVLPSRQEGVLKGKIILKDRSSAFGTLIADYDPAYSSPRAETGIQICQGATFDGIAYSKTEVQIEGTVKGCVVTKQFQANRWEKGAIQRPAISPDYVLPKTLEDKFQKSLIIDSWERL